MTLSITLLIFVLFVILCSLWTFSFLFICKHDILRMKYFIVLLVSHFWIIFPHHILLLRIFALWQGQLNSISSWNLHTKLTWFVKDLELKSKGKLKVLETSFLSFSYIYTPPLTNFDYKNLFLTRKYRLTARLSYHIIFHKSYTHKTDNTFQNDKYIQYS